MVYSLRFFFSSKCCFFHNSNVFGSCIIHILYTGCAKIKKIIPAPKCLQYFGNGSRYQTSLAAVNIFSLFLLVACWWLYRSKLRLTNENFCLDWVSYTCVILQTKADMNRLKKPEASRFVSVCSNAKLSPYTICLDYMDFAKEFQSSRLKMP